MCSFIAYCLGAIQPGMVKIQGNITKSPGVYFGVMSLLLRLRDQCSWPGWSSCTRRRIKVFNSGGSLEELLEFQDQALPYYHWASPLDLGSLLWPQASKHILELFTIFHPNSRDQQVPLRSLHTPAVSPVCPHCL